MITQTNYPFGTTKPEQYMLVDEGVRINTDIRSEEQTIGEVTVTVWYATSSLILVGDDAYMPYKRMIELQKLSDEHDELIAELIEGGNA